MTKIFTITALYKISALRGLCGFLRLAQNQIAFKRSSIRKTAQVTHLLPTTKKFLKNA